MKNKLLTAVTSLLFLLLTSSASAMLIDGRISFTGVSTTTTDVPATVVTSVTFGSMYADIVTGSFTAITPPTAATFNTITVTDPTYALWSIGGFTFDLLNIDFNEVSIADTASLRGHGMVTHDDYDDTAMVWVYTTQVDGTGNSYDTFSAKAVPAPAGIAFLGVGLIVWGFVRRNRK